MGLKWGPLREESPAAAAEQVEQPGRCVGTILSVDHSNLRGMITRADGTKVSFAIHAVITESTSKEPRKYLELFAALTDGQAVEFDMVENWANWGDLVVRNLRPVSTETTEASAVGPEVKDAVETLIRE